MKKYKHIFFDLDRTIWDFDKNSLETFKEIYDKYKLKDKGINTFENFHKTYRQHNLRLWDLYRKGELKKEVLSVERFVLTLKDFGIEDRELAKKIAAEYINISPLKTNLFPHTRKMLNYLKDKYYLHIITNGFEEVQFKKIEANDLKKYFTEIITSEEAGCKKPDKNIFLYSLLKTNAVPEESLMIGDDISVDIQGAKTVGMDQVFFNFDNLSHSEEITYEINSMEEISKIL